MDDGVAARNDDAVRLIRGKRKKAILGRAASALLVVGFFAAPRVSETDPPAVVPAEPAAPLIQGVAQREPFRGLRVLQETGRSAVRHTTSLVVPSLPPVASLGSVEHAPASRPAPLSAVAIRPGVLLANLRAVSGPSPLVMAVSGTAAEAVVERCDPETGLTLLRVGTGIEVVPAPLRTDDIAVGEAGVGVARPSGVLTFDPVLVSGSEEGHVRLTFARLAAGTPVFDSEGRLAVIAGSDDTGWTVGLALRRLDGLTRPIPTTLGVSLQPITSDLGPRLTGPGILITDVEIAGAADAAGLLPGDVLVGVGEGPVSTAADVNSSLISVLAGSDVRLRIRREKRELEVMVTPQAVYSTRPPITRQPEGPRAESLFSLASLARAGVPPKAVVLSVDGATPANTRRGRRAPRLVRFQVQGQPPAFAFIRP